MSRIALWKKKRIFSRGGGGRGGRGRERTEFAILNILLSERKKDPRSRKIVLFEKVRDSAVDR